MPNWEGGKLKQRVGGKDRKWEALEGGIRTRRRPIGRDYAAAKDAEWGMEGPSAVGSKEKSSKLKAQGSKLIWPQKGTRNTKIKFHT
jgi:hypothetical protein